MSYPTVLGRAVEGLLFREAQSCLGVTFRLAAYYFFLANTSTPANVYEDGALTIPFPITGYVSADAYGRFPPIYLDTSVLYKVQFYDSTNTLHWTANPYTLPLATVGTSALSAYGLHIAATGEVTVPAPNTGGSGVSLTLVAGALGSAPLKVSAPIPGQSAIIVNLSATTGAQAATFTATNKPGTATSSPAAWLPITCDGVQYYTPIWHGNNFTPYGVISAALGETISATTVDFTGSGLTTVTGGTAVPGSWFSPNTANVGTGYWINITKTGGLSGLAFSAAQGAWTNITSGGITISSNAAAALNGTYQLSTSNTGSPIVANGTIALSGGTGVQQPTYNGVANLVLGGDGTATLNGLSAPNWFTPTTAGTGAGYYILITQTGGTAGYGFSAATGAYTNITSGGLTVGISGSGSTSFNVTGTYVIASDSAGVHQLGTGTLALSGTSGGGSSVQSPNWSGTTPLFLGGDGSATLNGASTSSWFSPNVANSGSGYWIDISRTSGTSGVNFSAAQGSWTNITNSGLTIGMTGYTGDVGTVSVGGNWQISSSSSGTPVLGSGTISLSVSGGTVIHVYTTAVTNATEIIPVGTTNVYEEVWGSGGSGGGAHSAGGGGYNQGGNGGAAGFSYSVYTAAALGGAGKTFTYTVPAGGAGGGVGFNGTSGTAGSIVAGTVTGFTSMTANGGSGGVGATSTNNGANGAGGTASGGNTTNTTGVTGATTGIAGSISGDGSPYGGGGGITYSSAGLPGQNGACVFYYT